MLSGHIEDVMSKLSEVVFFDAKRVNDKYDFVASAKRVIDSHWYILGNEVNKFESEFSDYLSSKHCISLANGTEAIEISLRAAGVTAGDYVVTTANAGFYSSTAIYAVGAIPVYVDIEPLSLTMCATSFASALSYKPKAVIITHLYGQLSPAIFEIIDIAKQNDIVVVEDCAQAHGAFSNGKRAGTIGDIASFSFYPTKNLGALGDGGAIVTNNDEFAQLARQIRQYGWSKKYHVELPGGKNSRLDEMQAAFLREKLPHLDHENEERRKIAIKYNEGLKGLPISLPFSTGNDYVAHLYIIQSDLRDELITFLKAKNIGCDIHYPIPDYEQEAYSSSHVQQSLAVTETKRLCSKCLRLIFCERTYASH